MSGADGLPLGGEVRFEADGPWFTECASGRRYPVLGEGAFVDLERVYRETGETAGAPIYVTFDGAIVTGPESGGAGRGPSVIVHRFIHAWPHQQCQRALADAALTNTYWRIVRIGDLPVRADWDRREPHLILRGEGPVGRYVATLGCNPLAGDYALGWGLVHLRPAPSVAADCPQPLAALERAFEEALTKARRWRIKASTLELFDAARTPLALFEAVYF
ncbi:MAG: META domain-containing protein [Chromatiaceae bacterium]|nr:META domain-containing protein [Chromatiaceae bacterium]